MKFAREGIGRKLIGVMVLQMLITIMVVAALLYTSIHQVSFDLIEDQLSATAFTVCELYEKINNEDFSYSDNMMFKGEYNLTENEDVIDKIHEKTGVEITIMWEDVRAATTLLDTSGNRVVGTKLDSAIAVDVLAGREKYVDTMSIAGSAYSGYYMPLVQPSNGETIGIVFAGRNKEDITNITQSNIIIGAAIMFVIAFVLLIICLLIIRSITVPLRETYENLQELSKGKLSIKINEKNLKRKDEIGGIENGVFVLKNNLTNIICEMQSMASSLSTKSDNFQKRFESISENMKNINIAVEEIAQGNTTQAQETAHVASEVSNMGRNVDANVTSVGQLNKSVSNMSDYAKETTDDLNEVLSLSQKTADSIDSVKKQTEITNDSAIKIQEAVKLIQNIASQTNLLSLNASIEAARVGEAGKGFAVVAGEISKLSEESNNSAAVIDRIVNDLIKNSNLSVEEMKKVQEATESQKGKLEKAHTSFNGLIEEVNLVSQISESIAEQARDLEEIKNVVGEACDQLSSISQETAASCEETSASVQTVGSGIDDCADDVDELVVLSSRMDEQTNKFQL